MASRLAELPELKPVHRGTRQSGRQLLCRLPGPEPQRQQDRGRRLAPDEGGDQLDRRAVTPVQVVEHKHQRLLGGDQPQQPPDRLMSPVALVRDRFGAAIRTPSDGRTRPSSCSSSGSPAAVPAQLLRDHVGVERVDEDAEWQSRSNSAAAPDSTACPRASARSRSSASSRVLPIPGSPSTVRQAAPPRSRALERLLEAFQLRLAPDDRPGARASPP